MDIPLFELKTIDAGDNMSEYLFEYFSDDWKRVINQNGVRACMPSLEGNEEYNSIWDGKVAPDGRFYMPFSSEGAVNGVVHLKWYDYDTNDFYSAFDGRKVLQQQPRQMPHSKIHTALNPIPRHALFPECPDDPDDYLMIGTTHCTGKAPDHPASMTIQMHNHVWEGFPGSQIVVYDPKSGHAFTLGTPVPRESIYGSKYDPVHNRLYMIGFTKGHVYSYDLNERIVTKDLGKISEIYTYRLVYGLDGNMYGCTKSGQMFRINTEENELENLEFRVPEYGTNYINNTFYRYMVQGNHYGDEKAMYFITSGNAFLYRYDYETEKVENLGSVVPGDGLYKLAAPQNDWHLSGFAIDNDGVFWFMCREFNVNNEMEYELKLTSYLIRWDYLHGGKPFCCGMIGTKELTFDCASEMEFDHRFNRLFITNTCTERPYGMERPACLAIDIAEFSKHFTEPGPVSEDPYLVKVKRTPEEREAFRIRFENKVGEENSLGNSFYAYHPDQVTPVRIWRSLPRLEVNESQVIGMAFANEGEGENYRLYAVCGSSGDFDSASYILTVENGAVSDIQKFAEAPEQLKDWLRDNVLPRVPGSKNYCTIPEGTKLPKWTGRGFRAVPTCVVPWNGNRKFAGTHDAYAAIVSENGKVFSLGQATAYGPVRSMVTDKEMKHLWGVAGDDEDLGYIFTYDDENGLNQLGVLNYNMHGCFDGPTAANVLSSIALSPDEKYLAIGSKDRIATIHMIKL